ncbi:MAG: Gfo/Idh/MocA family oxidoreductase [Clostridiaceae bacterium]|nr:Gfo/Idh/MocA family oxidoreductase [Clostridiaceae bacterium]MDY3070978.1 Gfo/Idh/MocA family oxidoreductase [Eubacteriales bacterium]MDY5014899.1 Gfo/Idh/MocA family oxidoreductase [Eubacteriales bacterium]
MKEKIRVGYVGLGGRGQGQMGLTLEMEDVEVVAVCDVYEDRVQEALQTIREKRPELCAQGYTDYRKLVARPDLDAVVVTSSWQTHARIAEAAMRAGKYAAIEVGGASSLEECWRLVRAYEETGMPLMMLENCCYGRNEMALLSMVKRNIFGELIHLDGAYAHDLRDEITGGLIRRHYRFRNFQRRNGDLYPTHALGPIANMLSINRGNRFVSLTSMSSKSRGLHDFAVQKYGADHEYAKINWNEGDICTTLIKCANGETIRLEHDDCLARIYSRELTVRGTRGMYGEDGDRLMIEGLNKKPEGAWEPEWMKFTEELPKYEHPLWKWFQSAGVKGGHGGMDFLVQRAFFESVKAGTGTPIDAYDTASWMSITTLSEQSVAMGSLPVPVPDFTNGLWLDRAADPKSRYSLDAVHYDLF